MVTLGRRTIQFKHDFLSYLAVQKIFTYSVKQCSHVEFPYFVMGSYLCQRSYYRRCLLCMYNLSWPRSSSCHWQTIVWTKAAVFFTQQLFALLDLPQDYMLMSLAINLLSQGQSQSFTEWHLLLRIYHKITC